MPTTLTIPDEMVPFLKGLGLNSYILRGQADAMKDIANAAPPEFDVDVRPYLGVTLLNGLADLMKQHGS